MSKEKPIPSRSTTRMLTVLLFGATVACGGERKPEMAGFPQFDRSREIRVCHQVGLGEEGGTEVVFGRILSAVRGDAGSLYVLDGQSLLIHRFDRDGRHVGSFGGEGEGPGELLRPVTMAYADGAVQVWDRGLSRITTFSREGDVLTVQPVAAMPTMAELPGAWRLSDGNWIYADYRPPQVDLDAIRGGEQVRGSANLMRWSPAKSQWEYILQVPGPESVLYVSPNGVRGALPAPLAREPLWAPARGEEFWYADSGSYRVVRMNLDGDTVGRITAAFDGERATGEDRETYLERFREASPAVRQVVEGLAFPDRHPALEGLRVATTGEVWVKPVISERQHWHVFSPEGDPLFSVEWPGDRRVEFIQADTLVAVGTDPLGVQFVETVVLGESADVCNGG